MKKKFLFRTIILTFTLIILLMLVDRFFYYNYDYLPVIVKRNMLFPIESSFEKIVRPNKYTGYTMKPNIKFTAHFGKDKSFSFKTNNFNNLGFRTLSLNTDILFFGDSFIFGYGLKKYDTIDYILSHKYNIKVFNAGTPGYSLFQSYLLYKNYFSNYKSKKVFFFYSYNDVKETYYYNFYLKSKKTQDIDYFEYKRKNTERLRKYKIKDSYKRLSYKKDIRNIRYFLSWHSTLYNILKDLIKGTLFNTYFQILDKNDFISYFDINKKPLNSVKKQIENIIKDWDEMVKKNKGQFVFVYLPCKEEVIRKFNNIDYSLMPEYLKKICEKYDIKFISLTDKFLNKNDFYFKNDPHFNSLGAKVAAEELNKFDF